MIEVGDDTKGPVICFGKDPFHKRPVIARRDGGSYRSLGWFRNEEDLDRFLDAFCQVFNLRLPEKEDE